MIGVRFKIPVRPYGAGDTAMLPEDAAQAVVDSGEAELYEFPAAAHAQEAAAVAPAQGQDAGFAPTVTKPMKPGSGRQGLKTKGS